MLVGELRRRSDKGPQPQHAADPIQIDNQRGRGQGIEKTLRHGGVQSIGAGPSRDHASGQQFSVFERQLTAHVNQTAKLSGRGVGRHRPGRYGQLQTQLFQTCAHHSRRLPSPGGAARKKAFRKAGLRAPLRTAVDERDRELSAYLGQFLTAQRRQRIEQVLAERTRRITVVLENIYQPHNASACLRSCEILGVQDIHIVEDRNRFQSNPEVEMGAARWLSLHRYRSGPESIAECLNALRGRGFRLLAANPAPSAATPWSVDLNQPLALVFGTEEAGLSDTALAMIDDHIHLPMFGFTQSFNISVTVAVMLNVLMERLRRSEFDWRLSETEREELSLEWIRRNLQRADELERRFDQERSARAAEDGA